MPEPKLVIIGENMNGKEFPLNEGENRIGRVVENEIVLKDRSISRRHAVVRNENGACVIEDIGSHNGIEINGTKVQSCELSHGLEFRLGDFLMLYTDEAPGSQALINQPQVPAQWQELFDGSKPSEPPNKSFKSSVLDFGCSVPGWSANSGLGASPPIFWRISE